MSSLFLKVLSMSLTASYVVLAVIIVRFFLKKAPKFFSYILWSVVLFRLLCPFTVESSLSLMPANIESIPESIVFANNTPKNMGVAVIGNIVIDNTVNNTVLPSLPAVNPDASVNSVDVIIQIGSIIWLSGIIILIIYGLITYFKLKHKLSIATIVNDNIFETDQIKIPFVMGIMKPNIYIPVNISNEEFNYILKHEQTHIKRYDYIIKPLSFLALTIHWFNPLMWISYFLMSKDMEMSCDESVMKNTTEDIRANYSNSLLSLSANQSGLLAPLAFGENNVKSRIKNILNYKKTSFWVFSVVIVIVIGIVVALGTNPINEQQYQFPLKTEDIENVLAEQGIGMNIIENNAVDDTRNIATLRNEDNVTFGIDSQVRNNYKVLGLTWYLPKSLSSDQVYDFFHNELSNQFELAGIFYGNKKGLDKTLNEILDYYLYENNDNGIYWSERVDNDHLKVNISNQTISLQIIHDEIYEDYLRAVDEGWRNTAETEKIKISNSTVAEMVEEAKDDIPSENEIDIFSKHFVIKGQLKNIKENKKVPEALIIINSNYLMPNKDKYLSAKLVDNTGSVDVFLQMTSLNSNQLSMERNHNIVLLYNNNEPVYVVRFSAFTVNSNNNDINDTAVSLLKNIYEVTSYENFESVLEGRKNLMSKEVNNPEGIVSLDLATAKDIYTTYFEEYSPYTTEKGLERLFRLGIATYMDELAYSKKFYTKVDDVSIEERNTGTENSEYTYTVKLNFIKGDKTVSGEASGIIGLKKIKDNKYMVDFINRTDSAAISEILVKLSE